MDNKQIVERVFLLVVAARAKNDAIATALNRATLPLLEYPDSLEDISRSKLLRMPGIGKSTVKLVERLIEGEEIDVIVEDIPQIVRKPHETPRHYQPKDRGNWDGGWDNSIRQLEGD